MTAKPNRGLGSASSIAQFADEWGVSIRTVSRWIEDNKLHVHRVGRVVRISGDDARAFAAIHRR